MLIIRYSNKLKKKKRVSWNDSKKSINFLKKNMKLFQVGTHLLEKTKVN